MNRHSLADVLLGTTPPPSIPLSLPPPPHLSTPLAYPPKHPLKSPPLHQHIPLPTLAPPTPLKSPPHEVDHPGLPLGDVLRAEEDCLHQRDKMLRSAKPEDVEAPEVRCQQEDVREDESREQVIRAVNEEGALGVVFGTNLYRLQWE